MDTSNVYRKFRAVVRLGGLAPARPIIFTHDDCVVHIHVRLISGVVCVCDKDNITSACIPTCTLIYIINCLCADKERCPREVCVYKRERAGVLMVECDGCNQWYHSKCAHLTKKEAETSTNWFCQQCVKK